MNDVAFKQMATGMSQNMTFDQSKVELLVEWSLKADRKTYVYGYTDLLKLDLRDALKNISINTLILGASFPDKNMISSTYEKQYANLRSKEIIIADNSKHFIMFDQPEWLQKNINTYLKVNVKK
jgi:pimeloyl-ACP methyl ester carboxylesterase